MAYLPWLSESTLTVIFVLRFFACTKAPRNALPSGPVTVPAIVAAFADDADRTTGHRQNETQRKAHHRSHDVLLLELFW